MPKNILVPTIVVLVVVIGVYLIATAPGPKSPVAPGSDQIAFDTPVATASTKISPVSTPIATPSPKKVASPLSISPSVTPQVTIMNGLKIEDLSVGTGPEVKSGDTISINYLGTLLDGKKFDSSYDRGQPFETQIGVGQVIKGWDLGVVGMKVGGKRRLTIPPELGYGSRGAGNVIPPDATLVFEVELMGINK